MDAMSREQFKRKWAEDKSVKNFLINNMVSSKLGNEKVTKPLTKANDKVKDLVPATTDKQREEGFTELVFDGITVKNQEVLDMDIKDLMTIGLKLIEGKKRQDSGITVNNFTFGDLVKKCYEHPDKVETIDI